MQEQGPAITVSGVTRRFGAITAVSDVSFEVKDGEIFGLLGHNGAGKTTLIRLINGLLSPDQGSIRTLGNDPTTAGNRVRRRTGVLTEYPALDQYLTPAENLGVYAAIHGLDREFTRAQTHRLLQRFGLNPDAKEPARSLSAGLKQRVALARALVHDPDLLLLDEPTSNLDPLAARGVRDLVLELSREHGRTVLLSTHNLAEAQELCDRVAIMWRGQLLAVGSVAELAPSGGTSSVHLELDAPEAGLRIAQEHSQISPPALLADGRTIEVRLERQNVAKLVAALVEAGIGVEAVVPQHPSLEDIYVSTHARIGTDDQKVTA